MKYARYFRINMENFYDELANTALEIAKRLGIEANKDYFDIFDESENCCEIEPEKCFILFYKVDENNYFGISIDREHMQYNFDTNVMYGFFEYSGCTVPSSGKLSGDDTLNVIKQCIEIHNSLNYIKE